MSCRMIKKKALEIWWAGRENNLEEEEDDEDIGGGKMLKILINYKLQLSN